MVEYSVQWLVWTSNSVDVNLQTESEISKSTIVVMYVFKKKQFFKNTAS